MKTLLLILTFIFLPNLNYGQKWYLHRNDAEGKYKYEYWFSFQNEDDKNSIEIFEKPIQNDSSKLEGFITDSNGEPIMFTDILIKDTSGNIISHLFPDLKGYFFIEKQLGSFEISVIAGGYDNLITKINLKPNLNTNLKIKLGKAPEVLVYQINAKSELTPDEITEIINCVKKKRDLKDENYLQNCSNSQKFRLCMHI